jgi:mannose-6-phosphate isomerase-like protein (cupin superfamily)
MNNSSSAAQLGPGTVLHNPVTSEWARVLSSDDNMTRAEVLVPPGGGVPFTHRHAIQTERFDVLSGELTVVLDGVVHSVGAGETATVEPGVAHRWTSTGQEPLYCVLTVTPSLRFPDMIAVSWGLCARGQSRPDGSPNIGYSILMAEAFAVELELTSPPHWVQRLAVRALAPLVRAAGRRIDDPQLIHASVVDADRWPGPHAAARKAEVPACVA